jgi:hypothetical protein
MVLPPVFFMYLFYSEDAGLSSLWIQDTYYAVKKKPFISVLPKMKDRMQTRYAAGSLVAPQAEGARLAAGK